MSTLFLEVCSKGLIAQAKREGVWCLRCVWHRGGLEEEKIGEGVVIDKV